MQVTAVATIDVTPLDDTLSALSALVASRMPTAQTVEVDGRLRITVDLGTVEV